VSRRLASLGPGAAFLALLALAAGAPSASARLAAPPPLTAPAAILVEASTGTPVLSRAALSERPIASTTKLMTALITLERARLSSVFTAPAYAAAPAESRIGLRPGERMRVDDLLRALLLPSANDAAATLAVGVGGSRVRFVAEMNAEARKLGLRHTHYTTPVGLDDPGNFSDAADLARLAILDRRNPFFARTVDERQAVLRSGDHLRVITNRNTLLGVAPWINGVKTGHTLQAGDVLVGSGTRHGLTFISVVLGAPSEAARDADSLALLRYGFANFGLVRAVRAGQLLGERPVRDGGGERAQIVAGGGSTPVLAHGRRVTLALEVPAELRGPLPARARVGTLAVRSGRAVLARIPALSARAVAGPSTVARAEHAVGGPFTLFALAALLAAGAALVAWRRLGARRRRADIETA